MTYRKRSGAFGSDGLEGLPGIYQTNVPTDVLQARRRRAAESIPAGGLALVQGAGRAAGSGLFRQSNEMYHLTGIEVPHSYLTIDGRTGWSTLYLPGRDPEMASVEGELLHADDPQWVVGLVGVDAVRPLEMLPRDLARYVERALNPTIAIPLRQPELATQSRDDLLAATAYWLADPFRTARTQPAQLLLSIQSAFPEATVVNLSPVLDELRQQKDAIEIELLRTAGSLCARGITEAMRSTAPGMMEYELAAVAQYVFMAGGSRGDGYRAIVAGGSNAWHGHYGRQASPLIDGELVLMDYAPDFAYYSSDIGRMWPVNGRFSDAQRALYGYIVEYHRALLSRIRPDVLADEVMDDAAAEMARLLDETKFGSAAHERAARDALSFRGHLSHPVGMSVHDVGGYKDAPLRVGAVISVDPMLWVHEEQQYVRCEDTIVVTEDGCEVLTAGAPLDCDEIEAAMQERGLAQAWEDLEKGRP